MSRRRYFLIVLAVGLAFVATTAAYVAFLSGSASGRRGRGAETTTSVAAVRPPQPPRRRPRTAPRLPLTGAALEGIAGGPTSGLLPPLPVIAPWNPDRELYAGAFAVSTTERRAGALLPLVGGPRPGGAGGGAAGAGASRVASNGRPPLLGRRLFSGDGDGDAAPFRLDPPAPTVAPPLPNVIPEPAAPLVFAASAVVVAAVLRCRVRRSAGAR